MKPRARVSSWPPPASYPVALRARIRSCRVAHYARHGGRRPVECWASRSAAFHSATLTRVSDEQFPPIAGGRRDQALGAGLDCDSRRVQQIEGNRVRHKCWDQVRNWLDDLDMVADRKGLALSRVNGAGLNGPTGYRASLFLDSVI
jgi:hypothetical protein